jgi:hypothetical protein
MIGLVILGYFCYDLCDVISNRRGSDLLELLVHHIVVSFSAYIYIRWIWKEKSV